MRGLDDTGPYFYITTIHIYSISIHTVMANIDCLKNNCNHKEIAKYFQTTEKDREIKPQNDENAKRFVDLRREYWEHEYENSSEIENLVKNFMNMVNQNFETDTFQYEFIQNADDSNSKKVFFKFDAENKKLYICNDGDEFTYADFLSITNIGKSSKKYTGEDKIGYMGVGFKSIFKVAKRVDLHSGHFHVKFELKDIQNFTNEKEKNVDPHLMPYWIDEEEKCEDKSFKTIFVAHIEPKKIELVKNIFEEFEKYDANKEKEKDEKKDNVSEKIKKLSYILLFLKNLSEIKIEYGNSSHMIKKREIRETSSSLKYGAEFSLDCDGKIGNEAYNKKERFVKFYKGNVKMNKENPIRGGNITHLSVAFPLDEDGKPIRAEKGKVLSTIYSFTPVEAMDSGLGFIIESDFQTKNYRKSISMDSEWNKEILEKVKEFILNDIVEDMKNHEIWKYHIFNIFYTYDLKSLENYGPFKEFAIDLDNKLWKSKIFFDCLDDSIEFSVDLIPLYDEWREIFHKFPKFLEYMCDIFKKEKYKLLLHPSMYVDWKKINENGDATFKEMKDKNIKGNNFYKCPTFYHGLRSDEPLPFTILFSAKKNPDKICMPYTNWEFDGLKYLSDFIRDTDSYKILDNIYEMIYKIIPKKFYGDNKNSSKNNKFLSKEYYKRLLDCLPVVFYKEVEKENALSSLLLSERNYIVFFDDERSLREFKEKNPELSMVLQNDGNIIVGNNTNLKKLKNILTTLIKPCQKSNEENTYKYEIIKDSCKKIYIFPDMKEEFEKDHRILLILDTVIKILKKDSEKLNEREHLQLIKWIYKLWNYSRNNRSSQHWEKVESLISNIRKEYWKEIPLYMKKLDESYLSEKEGNLEARENIDLIFSEAYGPTQHIEKRIQEIIEKLKYDSDSSKYGQTADKFIKRLMNVGENEEDRKNKHKSIAFLDPIYINEIKPENLENLKEFFKDLFKIKGDSGEEYNKSEKYTNDSFMGTLGEYITLIYLNDSYIMCNGKTSGGHMACRLCKKANKESKPGYDICCSENIMNEEEYNCKDKDCEYLYEVKAHGKEGTSISLSGNEYKRLQDKTSTKETKYQIIVVENIYGEKYSFKKVKGDVIIGMAGKHMDPKKNKEYSMMTFNLKKEDYKENISPCVQ